MDAPNSDCSTTRRVSVLKSAYTSRIAPVGVVGRVLRKAVVASCIACVGGVVVVCMYECTCVCMVYELTTCVCMS